MLQMLRRDVRHRQARLGQQLFHGRFVRIGENVHTASYEVVFLHPLWERLSSRDDRG
jgi:hypothetical protein